jgi:hypothetical protein
MPRKSRRIRSPTPPPVARELSITPIMPENIPVPAPVPARGRGRGRGRNIYRLLLLLLMMTMMKWKR